MVTTPLLTSSQPALPTLVWTQSPAWSSHHWFSNSQLGLPSPRVVGAGCGDVVTVAPAVAPPIESFVERAAMCLPSFRFERLQSSRADAESGFRLAKSKREITRPVKVL